MLSRQSTATRSLERELLAKSRALTPLVVPLTFRRGACLMLLLELIEQLRVAALYRVEQTPIANVCLQMTRANALQLALLMRKEALEEVQRCVVDGRNRIERRRPH